MKVGKEEGKNQLKKRGGTAQETQWRNIFDVAVFPGGRSAHRFVLQFGFLLFLFLFHHLIFIDLLLFLSLTKCKSKNKMGKKEERNLDLFPCLQSVFISWTKHARRRKIEKPNRRQGPPGRRRSRINKITILLFLYLFLILYLPSVTSFLPSSH